MKKDIEISLGSTLTLAVSFYYFIFHAKAYMNDLIHWSQKLLNITDDCFWLGYNCKLTILQFPCSKRGKPLTTT